MSDQARKLLVAGGLALILAAVAIAVSLGGSDGPERPEAGELSRAFEGVPQSGTVVGDPEAPLTVVEFGDMQCPFCAEFAAAVPEIVERHVASGELKLDFQVLAFIGPDSERLARLVAAASLQDLAWPMVETLYARQGAENSGYATEEFLREAAESVAGLDAERALADLDSPAVDEVLAAAESRARELGVEATPSFFVEAEGERPHELELRSLDADAFAAALEAHTSDSR